MLLILIPKAGVNEAGDNTVEYMDEAFRYYQFSEPSLHILRGPGLPLLIAAGYAIMGFS